MGGVAWRSQAIKSLDSRHAPMLLRLLNTSLLYAVLNTSLLSAVLIEHTSDASASSACAATLGGCTGFALLTDAVIGISADRNQPHPWALPSCLQKHLCTKLA